MRYRVAWTVNYELNDLVHPRIVWSYDTASFWLKLRPDHLLAAIWLQLAEYFSLTKEYRPCVVCGRLFEVSLDQTEHRKSKHYCTQACRFKAYRERQRQARTLRQQGMAVRAIAKSLETSVRTTQGWLATDRQKT